MNEELTRVFEKYELEAMVKCDTICSRCKAVKLCSEGIFNTLRILATALLEERAKPKDDIWKDAPEWADVAEVCWRDKANTKHKQLLNPLTRELPKTRTRIMAEEIASAHISNKDDLIDIIEQTINAHMEELKWEA